MKNWPLVELGEIFEIARGGSPRPIQNFITEDSDGVNWIMIGDASDSSKYITQTKKRILKSGIKKSRMVHPGDFLLTNSMSFGHPYIMKTSGCIHDGWLVLSDKKNRINQDYFYHLLGSDVVYREFSRRAAGSTVKNLNIELVQGVKIPLPPLNEQRRIAAILDKADEIRRKRKEAIRLTDELLRSVFLDMFGDPVINPKGWETLPLGNIATFLGGGTPSRKQSNFYKGSICWASSKDMNVDVLIDTQEHITREAIENSSTKLVETGVLLIVVKSKILMRRLPVARTALPTCFNQDIKAIILHDLSITRYLHQHLKLGQEILLRQARGVNTEGLTLDHLRNYEVMIPPAKQINRFVDLEKSLEQALLTNQTANMESQTLFNALMQRAFKGEL